MRKHKRGSSELADLRERAEHNLSKRSDKYPTRHLADLPKLLYELQVHQIELEMQNEELGRSHAGLQAARDRYAELYDFSPAGYLTLDYQGVIQEANLRAGNLLGVTRERLLHQPLIKFVVPDDQSKLVHHCRLVFGTGAKQSCDLHILSSDGPPLSLYLESQAFPNGNGALNSCRIALFDITEQKQREAEHDRLTTSWRLLLDSTREGICGIDLEGRLTFINKAGAHMMGLRPEELLGKSMHELMHHVPGGTPFSSQDGLLYKVLQTGRDQSVENDTFRLADGTAIPISYSASPLIEGGVITGIVVVFADLSERKRAEEQLLNTLDRVRALSQRLNAAREEEQKRIGRELHDELGVRLTCLKFDMTRLLTMLKAQTKPFDVLEKKIISMTEQLDLTIVAVQRLVTELRPSILDDLGLVAAINWQCRDFEQRSGISCACESVQHDIKLDPAGSTAAFRIFQEALTNVMRHANATYVRVLVKQANDGLMMEIQDDGRGISAEKLADSASLGLLGMRERASGLGGTLEIKGYPGKGTTVRLYLPGETSGDDASAPFLPAHPQGRELGKRTADR